MINDLTVNKLMLLHILNKTNIPIDSSELADFIIRNDYSDYFGVQQYFSDLLKSAFIYKISQDKKTFYIITTEGSNTLDYFTNRIPREYYSVLDEFCSTLISKNGDVVLYTASTTESSANKYELACSISKNGIEVLSLNVSDLTKELSSSAEKLWKDNGKDIYQSIKNKLGL